MDHQQLVRAAAVTAVAVVGLVGCTGGGDDGGTPTPHRTQTTRPADAVISEEIFGRDDFIWRGSDGGADDQYMWSDGTGAGAYTVQIACAGGAMKVWQQGGSKITVRCDGAVHEVPVCNRERTRSVTWAKWVQGPRWDWAWQLLKRGDTCTPIDKGQA